MILYACVISMFIYVCDCIGLRNIVIMMYMYLAMLYPINDLNLNLFDNTKSALQLSKRIIFI